MFFKFSHEIVGLRQHIENRADIKLTFDSPLAAVVHISTKHSDGQEPAEPSSAVCAGTTTGDIKDDRCASEFDSALSNSLDGKWANFRGLETARTPLMFAAIDSFFQPLRAMIESTVYILRWRSGLSGCLNDPFRNRREHLSADGKSWLEIPTVRGLRIFQVPSPRQIAVSAQLDDEVIKLVRDGIDEPLGHRLFREAWNLRSSHPRSALVIGVAAAEVGLKKLIGILVPQAQWLVDEIQTPPFGKLLRKYLPSLPVKAKFQGKKIAPPGRLIKKLDRAFELRNKVVHVGKPPPHGEDLEQLLRAVDDFLWICDAYAGHSWVADFISADTTIVWENE